MGEFLFRQTVEMGDEAVQLGAKLSTLDRIGYPLPMTLEARLFRQIIEFWGRASESSGPDEQSQVKRWVGASSMRGNRS